MFEYRTYLPELIKTGLEAGEIVMDLYRDQSFRVEMKEDNTPVTTADKEASRFITESLLKLNPNIPVISEEEPYEDYSVRRHYDFFWCVDPIDGTREFIKANGEFTVNIALIYKNRPVMASIHAPAKKLNYYALAGEGAWKFTDHAGRTEKLPIHFDGSNALTMIVSRSSFLNGELRIKDNLEKLGFNVHVDYCGSTLKQCRIAEGKADIYPKLGRTREWDTAAADLIVKESGGRSLYLPGLRELDYNKTSLLYPHFVALNAKHAKNPDIYDIISSI